MITLSAVIFPVPGFSGDCTFWMLKLKLALSASTSMECVLRSRCGSAHTSSCVKSAPMPARPSAAATLTFAGKAAAPSRALPLKTHVAPFNPSSVMLFSTMWGAPCKALSLSFCQKKKLGAVWPLTGQPTTLSLLLFLFQEEVWLKSFRE